MNTQSPVNPPPNGILATAWLLAGIVPASAAYGAPAAPTPLPDLPVSQGGGSGKGREPSGRAVHPLS